VGTKLRFVKLFVVLFLSTAFIFSISHYGVKAFEKISNTDGKFSKGTTIGPLDVSGISKNEVISLLEEKYPDWRKNFSINLQYGEESSPLGLEHFHLDSKKTVDSIKDGQKNPAFITIDRLQVEEQVQLLFPQLKISDLNLEKLTSSLNSKASLFDPGAQTLNLYNDFLLANNFKENVVLSVAIVEMKEVPDDLQTVIEKNPTIEIQEESTFSLLQFANKQNIGNSDSLNIIATGIYQAILPSNFTIVERNIGSSLPDYASLGFEAKVNQNGKSDLVIANPNKAKYSLELQLNHGQLKVTLKGEKSLYNYKVSKKEEQSLKPKTIVQYSPQLLSGKTKVQTKGEDGQIVKIYKDVYQGDKLIKSELISEDYYPPVYRVEIHALVTNQQGASQTDGTATSSQSGTNATDPSNQNGNQTTTTTDPTQESSNIIMGKANEQTK
jgi:hypothetical protein